LDEREDTNSATGPAECDRLTQRVVETETLQFENARALQTLFANDLNLLKEIEGRMGVKLVTREGWVRIEGEPDRIRRARRVFEQLENARRGGVTIGRHEVSYALRSAEDAEGDGLEELLDARIVCSPKRAPILPKSAGQRDYIRKISAFDMVFGIGPAGTGKTYLAMAMAVAALKKDKVSRIILTRPAVEAGEALGFLPGDLREKIAPYLRPLYDALHDMLDTEEVQKYVDRGVVEVAPLAYMRGRTLNRAFVVLDEAQNTTTEQMFMFLTRLGTDSKCVITGDDTQIDLPPKKHSGLVEARHALRHTEGITFVYLDEHDVVRHPLVQSIVRADRDYRGGKDREIK
jgi:phosphate starvation-inducible PhoH-like protein